MAITYFWDVSYPTDNGTLAVLTQIITPPASMTAWMLCVIYLYRRNTVTAGFAVSQTGGQTWTDHWGYTNSTNSMDVFSCTFNGTWSGNLEVTFPWVSNTTAVMVVFQPTSTSYVFWLDTAVAYGNGATATTTITWITPVNNNNVSIASWWSLDDNTYGTLTGTNWTKTWLTAQYRNTAWLDSAGTIAYQIQWTKAATNNTSQTQLTLGADNTITSIICFYEYIPVALPNRTIIIS